MLSKYTAWIAVDTSRTTDSIIPVRILQPSYDSYEVLRSSMLVSPSYAPLRMRESFDAMADIFAMPTGSGSAEDVEIDSDWLSVIADELRKLLAGGRGNLDHQAVLTVLSDLRDWLDENDAGVIGRRSHGKIVRRLAKFDPALVLPAAQQWKLLNELLSACDELLARPVRQTGTFRDFFA